MSHASCHFLTLAYTYVTWTCLPQFLSPFIPTDAIFSPMTKTGCVLRSEAVSLVYSMKHFANRRMGPILHSAFTIMAALDRSRLDSGRTPRWVAARV
eukprot:scaffold120282_cov31-Tisochrysis_lutea.AAC.1